MNDISSSRRPLILLALCLFLSLLPACSTTAPKPAVAGKLHHIGLIWLKNPGHAGDRQQLIAAAHRFAKEIPDVNAISVGQSIPQGSALIDTTFDVCLIMHFDDQAALDRYAKHPVHQKAAHEAFLPLARKIIFYDFISE
ncbi:MAG: Dabb family protein [Verrucomicrobiota bacterium]